MILGHMEKTVSVEFCVGHKDMFCEQRISVWSVSSMWGKSQFKEVCDFYRGTHVMAISLTINLDYLPTFDHLLPELELSIVFLLFLMLQSCSLTELVGSLASDGLALRIIV